MENRIENDQWTTCSKTTGLHVVKQRFLRKKGIHKRENSLFKNIIKVIFDI